MPGARPVIQLPKSQNPPKNGILLGSLGVSVVPQRPPGANLSTGYPQPTVDNLIGVWEF